MSEEGITWKQAAITAAVVFVLAYGGLRLWSTRGHDLPQNSWFAFGVLVAMIVMVLIGGWDVRQYLRGRSLRIPSPLRARRTLVAGQACALGGSVVVAWYAAHAAVDARRLDVPSGQAAFWMAVLLAVAAIGLTVSGFVVQSWCRIPHDDGDDRRGRRGHGHDGSGDGPLHA